MRPSQPWKGATIATTVVLLTIVSIAKAGWSALAPFALAGVVVVETSSTFAGSIEWRGDL